MKLFTDPFVVLDTETTGVGNFDEIIEIGAVCIDEWGRIRSRFSTLVQPQKKISAQNKAMKVNQISLDDLEDAPTWEIVADYFENWLREIPTEQGEVICTAFNRSFDERMLNNHQFSLRWGECVRSLSNRCMKEAGQQPVNKEGRRRAPSLKEACIFFEIPYPKNAHRALQDAEVTALVALEAYKRQYLQSGATG